MLDLIIIFVGSMIVIGYYAWNIGFKKGMIVGTHYTLFVLKQQNIIDVDAGGNVNPKKNIA